MKDDFSQKAQESLSTWAERRPERTASERMEIADFFARHLPKPDGTIALTDADIQALKAAYIARFDEDLPRTETLFSVARAGYRMALRDVQELMKDDTIEVDHGHITKGSE